MDFTAASPKAARTWQAGRPIVMRPHGPRLVHNAAATRTRSYGAGEQRILSRAAFELAQAEISSWPGFEPTPLTELRALAAELKLRALHYKDESTRFGLGSFKALGGAYAVLEVLRGRLRETHEIKAATSLEFLAGRYRERLAGTTVAAATDGNHGRSVAWGARMFGCDCVIYLHEHVSLERERAIAAFGARIVRVPGHYDESVRVCAKDADELGWLLVADTADEKDARIPALVMQGYTLIAEEIIANLRGRPQPTHLFVQAGVGGLAAALGAHFWETLADDRPRLVVVEPSSADCVFRTVAAGRPERVPGDADTFMACLASAAISAPAWAILQHAADDVLAIEDEAAPEAMRLLARGVGGDPPLVAGESGCAATAGLLTVARDREMRRALGLDETSVVVVIGSEGATDPDTYEKVVGSSPGAIARSEPAPAPQDQQS